MKEDQQILKPAPVHSDDDLAEKLRELEALLPTEDFMEDLLSPLPQVGGAELLHDLASRTRVYKEAFQAWEQLHLHETGETAIQLQDVVHRLSISTTLSKAVRLESIRIYDSFRLYFSQIASVLFPWTMPYYGDHISLHTSFYHGGKGLVFTGGDRQVRYISTSIKAIRELGCSLPVEVLFLGDDDMREENRDKLEELDGVTTRNVGQMIADKGWTVKGWAAKPFAILMSSFREVIFIDADALFLQNPEILFHSSGYTETGALFFKDRNLLPENRRGWLKSFLPKPISHHVKKNRMWTGESGHMQDSGVVVVDKWKHFVALLLTTRLNGPDRDGNKSQGKKGVYEMVYGDKETFWLSWELADDLDYAFHDSVAGTMGSLGPLEPDPKKQTSPSKSDKKATKKAPIKQPADDDDNEDDEDDGDDDDRGSEEREELNAVCSAQLLHFDEEGVPLWFNGWLARTKQASKKLETDVSFEGYMKEPPEVGRHDPDKKDWHIRKSNVVCLVDQEFVRFAYQEQKRLKMLVRLAMENDS